MNSRTFSEDIRRGHGLHAELTHGDTCDIPAGALARDIVHHHAATLHGLIVAAIRAELAYIRATQSDTASGGAIIAAERTANTMRARVYDYISDHTPEGTNGAATWERASRLIDEEVDVASEYGTLPL